MIMERIKYFTNLSILTRRNNEFIENQKIDKFTDLTLKSTDGININVHKIILAAACPYFKAMFNSDLIESQQDEIQLVDNVTYADLQILIEYFYIGKATVSLENAENLYIKAQYFQLEELKQFCSDFLVENISIQNCLVYWRNSVKYLNDNLKLKCLEFIKQHCKNFLEINAKDLTAEELKLILYEENLEIDQEELYKFVATWIKEDFASRNIYLIDFMKNLDFSKISDEFMKSVVFCDETLLMNQQFSSKITSITFQKLQDVIKQLKNEGTIFNNIQSSKNIHLVTNKVIYMLNWSKWKWTKQFNIDKENTNTFATAIVNDEIFISGGKNKVSNTLNSDFESWNITSAKCKQLPKMLEAREAHKLVYFKGKIYCCGGRNKMGSTEVFDFENLKWNKGPTMNDSKYRFSLVTSGDSIYAFGGWNDDTRSNIVEQFDAREGMWRVISRDGPNTTHAAILPNNFVYCFNIIYGGKIFDLRTNTWNNSFSPVFEKKQEFKYFARCCDVVEFNDEIFGIFQTDNSETWSTFKYDDRDDKWANLRIPLRLNEYDDIRLCCV